MKLLLISLAALSLSVAQDFDNLVQDKSSLPPLIQEALQACGSFKNLRDGNCPPHTYSGPPLPPAQLKGAVRVLSCGGSETVSFVGINAPYNSTLQAYGFTKGSFQLRIAFTPRTPVNFLAATASGSLPVLPNLNTKKPICEVAGNACPYILSGNQCPIQAGEKVVYQLPIRIAGNYYPGLQISVKIQLFDFDQPASGCLQESQVSGKTPLVCLKIPAFIL